MQEGGVQARWTDLNKLKNLPEGTYKTLKMKENEAYIMANPDHYVQSTTNTTPPDIVQPSPGTPFKVTASLMPEKVAGGDAGGLNSRSTINKTTTEFKPTEDTSTAWANTWGTNKDRYNSEINSLTPWQQGQLRDDVLADNPNVIGIEQYKNDLPKFIEEATNDKVGVIHNAIAARQPKLLRSPDVKLVMTGDPGLVPMKRPTIPTGDDSSVTKRENTGTNGEGGSDWKFKWPDLNVGTGNSRSDSFGKLSSNDTMSGKMSYHHNKGNSYRNGLIKQTPIQNTLNKWGNDVASLQRSWSIARAQGNLSPSNILGIAKRAQGYGR